VLDKGGLVDNSEKTLLRKDGTGIPILKTVVPITLEGEEVLLEAFVDVSEMKAAQEQLMIFRRFVETAGQGFGMVTLDGKILYANPAILRMVGVESLSQIVGTSFKEYYSVDRARQIDEISPKLLEDGQWYGEMELLTPDGRVIPTIENFFIIKNEKNEPICFANIITDNTERKKWEREILEAKEKADAARDSAENAARETEKARLEAERANRSKSDFLANMSHEIRTPMNAIIGFTDILKSGSHTEEEEEYLDHIKNSGNHLLSLINDILDLSKIEAGRVEVDESPFDLRCVIKDTFNLVRLRMEEKELKSRLLFDENIPPYFIGDEKHLRQIILNLLSNAVKFTDKGSISVTVTESVEHGYNEPDYEFFTGGIVGQTMEDRCLDGDYFPVSITVADTGIGIARDKLGSIFDPFDRGSSSTSRSFEGTGLGLAITKRLVQMLGGRIGVESTPGRGSTFKVELPFKMVQDVSLLKEIRCGRTDGEDEISIQGIKSKPRDDKEDQYSVLVIEDDEASARLIELSLAQSGFRIFKASSGSKAFPILAREKIDLILLDIILPGMSGWDILRSLKQSVKYSGIPVVICSVLDEAKKGFSLGAVEYIEKPIDMKDLVARVEGLLTDQSRKRKIAIIEDEPDVMELLKTYFTRHNYDVAAFLNAEDALHHIKEFRDVDVIILDLMMPGMNGFEFLDNFQENIPVLVYTAKELTTEDFRILKAYFCRILHKGESSLGELGSEIAKIMSQQGRQVLGAGQKKEYDKFVKDRRRGTAILHESKTSARTTSELVQGRILLVEDNIVNQKLIKTYLKNYPFDVQVAGDGEEGVMRATGEQFDLILMDIQMPKLDGYGATEKIREHEAGTGKRVPIIALTAYAMKGDEERVLQGGFDGYLSKPIEKEKFFEAIGKYLRGRPASPKVLPKAPAPLKKLDPQVEKMVPWFVGILKKNLDKMKKSLEENDLPALGVMGHNLKGNASSFGFDEVAALGSSMEASATAQDAASLKKDVARLEEIVASLLKDFPPG
jgi:PAS domain S-box-containing protein